MQALADALPNPSLTVSAESPLKASSVTAPPPPPPSSTAMRTLWVRMAEIFGHRWASSYGEPDGGAAETDEIGHAVALQSRELVVWTRFHPDALPDWVEEVDETPHDVNIVRRDLEGAHSVHAVRRGFGPGALAIRWGYGEWTPRPDS